MLANFPVKYLDNEDMRPMYFSHKKTESTIMYGFGINGLKDSEEDKKFFSKDGREEELVALSNEADKKRKDNFSEEFSSMVKKKNFTFSNVKYKITG